MGLLATVKYRIANQAHKKATTWSRMMRLIFLAALLFTISACHMSSKPSDEQIEQAKKTVSQIRASLYTPANVELLAEELYHGSNPELYPGCVSGHVYLAYHSLQPFDEILEEYRAGLRKEGWEPRLGYPHDEKDHDVFQLGTQAIFLIASFPIREDLLVIPTPIDPSKQHDTIYYIRLLYYEPSISECSEM